MLYADHDCEIDLKTEQIFFLPIQTRWMKFLNFYKSIFLASIKNPRAHRYLRNRSAIIYERRHHLRNHTRIIHPFSIFSYWWDFIMVLNLVASFLFIPYNAAFDMLRASTESWTIMKNWSLFIDCIDIIINFSTGYFDDTQRIVCLNWKLMTKRYIFYGTFFADFLGSFPTDLLFIFNWNESIVTRELLSMIHVFRIFSLHTYISHVAETYNVPRRLFSIFTLSPLLVICLHWLACITWIIPVAVMSEYSGQSDNELRSSWTVDNDHLWSSDNQKKYWTCLMRSIAILTRSGFLSKEPNAVEDQLVAILIQIFSCILLCYIIGHTMQLFKSDNSSKLKYQTLIRQVKKNMSHEQLSKYLQKRYLTYYEFRYQGYYFNETEILNTISSQMKMEIAMHSCRKLVENATFFNNLSVSLLTRIVTLLKSEIFLINDVIIKANEPGDCMYFIATGTVAVYTDSGKEICHLVDGSHFGEIALVMPNEKRVATVIAIETCELYKLGRNDFIRTIHPYPMFWERIKKIAMERHEKTMILNAS